MDLENQISYFGVGFYINLLNDIKHNPSKVHMAFLESIKYISIISMTSVISANKIIGIT